MYCLEQKSKSLLAVWLLVLLGFGFQCAALWADFAGPAGCAQLLSAADGESDNFSQCHCAKRLGFLEITDHFWVYPSSKLHSGKGGMNSKVYSCTPNLSSRRVNHSRSERII